MASHDPIAGTHDGRHLRHHLFSHLEAALERKEYNSHYDIDKALWATAYWWEGQRGGIDQKLTLSADKTQTYIEMEEEHWNSIIRLTDIIEKKSLERVFLEWMERLERGISANNEDVEEDKFKAK
jgi:hypothetical protein